jgi:signal transduction histidine kinase
VRAIVAALVLAIASAAQATELTTVRTFESAHWVQHWYLGLPRDDAAWTPVSLPHNWYRNPPAVGNIGWYRIRFHLDYAPADGQSLYFLKLVLTDFTVYVNKHRIWRLSEQRARGNTLTAVLVPIPHGLLREGENEIHLEAVGNSRWYHGVSRFQMGEMLPLSEQASREGLVQGQMVYISAGGLGAVGILCLWLWWRAGRDPVLFWYGVSGISLLAATALWYETIWREDLRNAKVMLIFLRFYGYLAPILVLHLRLAGHRHLRLEASLWLALVAAVASIGIVSRWQATAWTAWSLAFGTLCALATIPLLASKTLRRQPAVILLIVADFAAALMTYHDWAARFGWLDFDRPFYVLYIAPFVMIAAGAVILRHLMVGVDALRESNVDLERRVAEKIREAQASHEVLRQVQRETALAEERRRIMADMHDGLGARLVALLTVAQSGKAKHGEISEGIAAALDELRLTVDSVQPVEGDVGVVLGNVRHRMRSVFERAGVRLAWNVSELPRMDDLTPERILAIQRIFLEAFSNAIRHSGARTVSVFTLRVPGAVRIVIEDDGRGFDAEGTRAGNGLGNLRLRAKQAGGTLSVESTPGKGTRVTLSLPVDGEGSAESLPRSGHNAGDSPVHGMAGDPASA